METPFDEATILGKEFLCDQLLQEFHRFDEEISLNGKWQGGTVTGVCRGWGTTKFLPLESIYQIVLTGVKNVRREVEHCLQSIVDGINLHYFLVGNFKDFQVPDKPCSEVDFGDALDSEEEIQELRDDIRTIFLKIVFAIDNAEFFHHLIPASNLLPPELQGAPAVLLTEPFTPATIDQMPLELLPREVRLDETRNDYSGHFKIDGMSLNDDDKPEKFIVEMFQDFIACSQSLSENLINSFDLKDKLFSDEPTISNPLFDFNNEGREAKDMSIPIGINKHVPKDKYGQLKKNLTLDELFNFYHFYAGSFLGIRDVITWDLQLIENYGRTKEIDAKIKKLEDEYDTEKNEKEIKKLEIERSLPIYDRSLLDVSIELLFGKKTSIGQVCAYAQGVENNNVEDVPGFCCLDAPYEDSAGQVWGEKVSL